MNQAVQRPFWVFFRQCRIELCGVAFIIYLVKWLVKKPSERLPFPHIKKAQSMLLCASFNNRNDD